MTAGCRKTVGWGAQCLVAYDDGLFAKGEEHRRCSVVFAGGAIGFLRSILRERKSVTLARAL
jgi:hypothetical protein